MSRFKKSLFPRAGKIHFELDFIIVSEPFALGQGPLVPRFLILPSNESIDIHSRAMHGTQSVCVAEGPLS